ncbi:Transposase [Anaerohalosphaera lusitana]|uniref:Mutator family transposase n=1 Tax=Anaerohalosphaera lusitana TaxID=1936003 RepID=A0A1U9NM56_9BACT|nr:IS256 family transposase [Anaerohalosphaera lusitana]AQT68808.1 Transposase [Anaerohalosphaera lusitana]
MQKNESDRSVADLNKAIKIDESQIQNHLGEMVRSTVEQTLNNMLDAEADQLCNAKRYERTSERVNSRAGHYKRNLHTRSGEVKVKMPKLRRAKFETAIIERYRRREASVEEALMEMYLAGVSVRRVEDITEALWGMRVSAGTVSDLNKKMYERIDEWRNRRIEGEYPYVYLDGICLKRSWGGEVRNVSVLVAIGVGKDGYRDILGVVEGGKEDRDGWSGFLRSLKQRGLKGVQLVVSDKCLGLVESLGEFFPDARWQRCTVHFYRNVFSVVPRGKMQEVSAMLKAIHAQEDLAEAKKKAHAVADKLDGMKLRRAAQRVREGAQETLSYYHFPRKHWRQIRTNNPLERIMREIRRRSRVVGCFPDGNSALMLAAARLRHIAGTKWGTRRYMNMDRLREMQNEAIAEAI